MWDGTDPRLLDTPENPPSTDFVCRRFFVPNDPQWLSLVNGVLSLLTLPAMYRRRGDGQEVIDTTAYFTDMFLYFTGYEPMLGAMLPTLAAALPAWALWCDGTTYDKAQFPELYDALDPEFKDEVLEQFTLPDMATKFIMGTNNPAAVGTTGGEAEHTLTEAEMPTHYHLYSPTVSMNLDLESPGAPDILGAGIVPFVQSSTDVAGGSQPHNNLPPFIRIRFFVVAKRRECW